MNRLTTMILFLPLASTAAAQRLAPEAPDAYGYVQQRSPEPACAYQYIDLDLGGTPLALTASGAEPAEDDGAAVVALPLPFEFYGQPADTLVVSSNGYIAIAEGLESEDGGHWRADCPLPAIPDNAHASFARVYALLDDLSQGTAGHLLWQHFADCPRPSGAVDGEACTVVQWRDWRRLGGSEPLDFQAVLYHASFAIAVQHAQIAGAAASGATVALQDHGASSAAVSACGGNRPLEPASAVCFFDPRFPAGGVSELIFRDGFEVE